MNITYYKADADLRKPNKSITRMGDPHTCTPFGDYDILTPKFLVSHTPPVNVNYLYCDDFNRYYLITNIMHTSGGRCILVCKEDCLYTYWNEIKTQNVTVSRNEYRINPNIIDNLLPLKSEKQIILKKFGEPLQTNENYYILGVI